MPKFTSVDAFDAETEAERRGYAAGQEFPNATDRWRAISSYAAAWDLLDFRGRQDPREVDALRSMWCRGYFAARNGQ